MTPLEFSLVFLLGLAGGLHCLQMCGPIVLSYSVSLAGAGAGRRQMLVAHAGYNAGRILTYMALGALAGAAGGGLGVLGRMAGLAAGARVLAGAAMILAGLLMLRVLPSTGLVRVERPGIGRRFSRLAGRLLRAASPTRHQFFLGLALGFLPCGLVYAALMKAMESANPLAGALTMLAFGLGTAVALFGMGLASGFAGLRMGRWGYRVAAASVMIAGAMLLWHGLNAQPVHHHG